MSPTGESIVDKIVTCNFTNYGDLFTSPAFNNSDRFPPKNNHELGATKCDNTVTQMFTKWMGPCITLMHTPVGDDPVTFSIENPFGVLHWS